MHTKNGVKDPYQKADVNRLEVEAYQKADVNRLEVKSIKLWHTKNEAKFN